MVLCDGPGRRAELEDGDLASCTGAYAEGHDRRAQPRAHVDRPIVTPAPVEAVHVFVPDEVPEGDLVKARERELPRMGVPREHEGNAVLPERVGLLRDVRQGERRQIAAHAGDRAVPVCVSGVCIVEPDDLECLVPHMDHRVLIAEHERPSALERLGHLVGPGPVVVIAEHTNTWRRDGANHRVELVEKLLTVADEIAGDYDQVSLGCVGDAHGLLVDVHGRDTADVHVGEVRDADGVHRLRVGCRPREAPDLNLAKPLLVGGRLEQLLERDGTHSSHDNHTTVDAELVTRVAQRYRSVSARMYAKGKLGSDPIAAQLVDLGKERHFGDVVDVGCGRGQMAVLLLEAGVATSVKGVDWDEPKLEEARKAAQGLPATFDKNDFRDVTPPPSDTLLLIDVLHYLTDKQQLDVLERCASAARKTIVLRELDPDRGWRSATTKMQEAITTFFGYNVGERVRVLPIQALVEVLERARFSVRIEPSWGSTPFSNVMVVGRR